MKCKKCGFENPKDIKYCGNCGSNLNHNNKQKWYIIGGILIPIIILVVFLSISSIYNDSKDSHDFREEESEVYKEFIWPDSEIAKLLPVPKSNIGKIEWEDSNGFVIYVSNTSKESYDEYVTECRNNGFTINYRKGNDYYYADNELNYHLSLNYEGKDVMFIRMDSPEKNDLSMQKNTTTSKNKKEKYDIEDSLTNIANTYYQNVTRGNDQYFKKNVKVTAKISDISVDESIIFNTGVTIHLEEDGAKYTMMCNNEKGIKGITEYNRGDQITVVGKMNTMVSDSLLMDNCTIIK